jgi:hypothetical protein
MKTIIIIFACLLAFTSCKKNPPISNLDYLTNVKVNLKNKLADSDFSKLDFHRIILSKQSSWLFRIGILQKNISDEFLLLRTDSIGEVNEGVFVNLKKNGGEPSLFNGWIDEWSLDRKQILSSDIDHGYIAALHAKINPDTRANMLAPSIVPSPVYDELPDVMVVAGTGSGISYTDYILLDHLLNFNPQPASGSSPLFGIYSPLQGGATGGLQNSSDILINFETSSYSPAIDINAYLKCFSTLPDNGATCSITIYCDLPVNDDPSVIFNWYTGATGHVFLGLSKTNIDRTINQFIGFQPQKPFQSIIAGVPVASKMVDNGGHKWNAALTMTVSPDQLNSLISQIIFLSSSMLYSITTYNCVDFALQVINGVRGVNPILIPKFQIPGQPLSNSNTPEGLYKELSAMKLGGGADANNIITNVVAHANLSHGPCN